MDDLPPPNTTRWVTRRKAAVVVAVRSGKITMEEALRRYQLSEEEFLSWQRAFETHGLAGLRATRVQQYRRSRPPPAPDRDADLAETAHLTEEQQALAADGISPSASVIAHLKMLHALWALGEHGSVGGQCSEQDPITSNHLSH